MTYHYKDMIVEVYNDHDYTLNSADNTNYLYQYGHEDLEYQSSSQHGIKVLHDGIETASAIIFGEGGATGIHHTSQIMKNDTIFICCGDSVYALSLPRLNLHWNKKLDMATCFQIFEFNDDFIVHGEVEVSKIDPTGNIKWQFGGRDIFVTLNNEPAIEVVDNEINLIDFLGYRYKLNGSGQII